MSKDCCLGNDPGFNKKNQCDKPKTPVLPRQGTADKTRATVQRRWRVTLQRPKPRRTCTSGLTKVCCVINEFSVSRLQENNKADC